MIKYVPFYKSLKSLSIDRIYRCIFCTTWRHCLLLPRPSPVPGQSLSVYPHRNTLIFNKNVNAIRFTIFLFNLSAEPIFSTAGIHLNRNPGQRGQYANNFKHVTVRTQDTKKNNGEHSKSRRQSMLV